MNLKTWIARHPILTYTLLMLIWSFGIWSFLFIYIHPGELMKTPPPISFLFVVLGGFGPAKPVGQVAYLAGGSLVVGCANHPRDNCAHAAPALGRWLSG